MRKMIARIKLPIFAIISLLIEMVCHVSDEEKEELSDKAKELEMESEVDTRTDSDVDQKPPNTDMVFEKDKTVNYKGSNDKPLKYTIIRVWESGLGYFDLEITGEDINFQGYFREKYLSVPYWDLLRYN